MTPLDSHFLEIDFIFEIKKRKPPFHSFPLSNPYKTLKRIRHQIVIDFKSIIRMLQ
jgi:hypothetical protein